MNITPDAWPADTEHLRAENNRLSHLETSLRAHLSRTINRAEQAEARIQAIEALCDFQEEGEDFPVLSIRVVRRILDGDA